MTAFWSLSYRQSRRFLERLTLIIIVVDEQRVTRVRASDGAARACDQNPDAPDLELPPKLFSDSYYLGPYRMKYK